MQRELLKVLFRCSEFSASSLPFTHVSVRFRKPIWLPKAPTKRFRVPKRPVVPPQEKLELDRLVKSYKTINKAILAYHADINARSSVTDPQVIEDQKKKEEEDWDRSNFLNNEWNAEVAAEREQRLAIEKEQKVLKILAEKEAKEAQDKLDIARAEQKVQDEIEKSKTFITRDNIDEHIERALSSHVDYNYAIDKDGNVYQGLRTNPLNSKEATGEKAAAEQ